MKADQIYHEMKLIAEKLNINVSEQNFRKTRVNIKSGLCKIRGVDYFYIDKDLPVSKKNEIIAELLGGFEYDTLFIIPAVRDFLNIYKKKDTGKGTK